MEKFIEKDILNSIKIGILVLNKNKECIYVNNYMEEYFLLTIEKINKIMINNEYLKLIHPTDIEKESKKCEDFFNNPSMNNDDSICRIILNNKYRWIKIKKQFNNILNLYIYTYV